MQRLATFVQVSDLHIGEIDPANGDAIVDAALAWVHQHEPWFDGYLGHQDLALKALERFMEQMRDDGEEPRLLVTGDLTRGGAPPEFDNANRFLSDEIDSRPPQQLFCGLRAGLFEERIPGNHDQWGGAWPPLGAAAKSAQREMGLAMPRVLAPIPLPNGRRLVFVCVDSDADVLPRTWDRALARGSFVSELLNPAADPAANSAALHPAPLGLPDIRVMLIHHSWHQRGLVLSMRRNSREALERFLADHRFCAVLSGHSHEPLGAPFNTQAADGTVRQVWELRCGTTTQHDQRVPLRWAHLINLNPWAPPLPPNNLLVHRIDSDANGDTRWSCQSYWRSASKGTTGQPPTFAPLPNAQVSFTV